MNLIFLGAPGAGKGTQSTILSKKLVIPHISTGDIFRDHIKKGTDLGILADSYISKGQLVPDDITISIVKDRISKPDCINGFIFDGFPRTMNQAIKLDELLKENNKKIDKIINIIVDENKLISRLSGRRVCPNCNGTYHVDFTPLKDNKCLNCGSELIQRKDDVPEVILKRLVAYHEQTAPLIDYYKKQNKLINSKSTDLIEESVAITLKALGISDK